MNATIPVEVATTGMCKTFNGLVVLDQVNVSIAANTILASVSLTGVSRRRT